MKAYVKAKNLRCQTHSLAALCRKAKTERARTERRAARVLLHVGADDIPPVIHADAIGWDRVIA